MKIIALIPARYGATRFPGKMMALLGGVPVICRTYEAAVQTGLFDEVAVVTDSIEIRDAVESRNGKAIMSRKEHECGTDRIAEAAADMDADIIVNVQGDEPFIKKEPLAKLLDVFTKPDADRIDLASMMQELHDPAQINDPNFVKVVVDHNDFALFFSRSPVPYPRNTSTKITYYEHIGVYAFRKQALLDFATTPIGTLEDIEKVECLRYLENGKKIKMVVAGYLGIEIDTPEDLANAQQYYSE